ncbi:MAG: YdcF family protein [Oscillospiraceae bacterium]|jgi:uncharacterized SAM-binding protein YcdF (DUF218 family)|nr:YdcF family protein [Oscillospiraceae bacterium]
MFSFSRLPTPVGYIVFVVLVSAIVAAIWLVCGRIRKTKIRRGVRMIISIVVAVALLLFVVALVPVVNAAKGATYADTDYALVLGNQIKGTTPTTMLTERLSVAIDWLDSHPNGKAVLSGGQGKGEDIAEAEAMYAWLVQQGADGDRLILEVKSTSTIENVRFSKALLPDNTAVAIITSDYHLKRAYDICLREELAVAAIIPAKTTHPLLAANNYIRETLIALYMWVFPNYES